MRLLERYILRRVLVLFAACLTVTILVTWIVQLLSRVNFLTTSGQSFLTLLQFSALFIPPIIPFVMPFALLLAVTLVLSTMNRDSELVVIAACSAPRRTIGRPLIILGILTAILSFAITNFLAPHARLAMRTHLAQSHADLINLLLQEGNFHQIAEGIYIEIGQRRPDGSIGQLFIVDESNKDFDLHYYAIDGMVAENKAGHFLILQKGEIQRLDKKSENISIIQFDSYSFDLSSFAPAPRSVTLLPKDQFLTTLLKPSPEDSYYQRRPLHYLAELHRRLTSWLFPIVFVVVALAAAGNARSHRESHLSSVFITLTFSLTLYWFEEVMVDWAENDPAFLPLLYLIPLGALIGLSTMVATSRRFAIPDQGEELLVRLLESIKNPWQNITNRNKRQAR